MTTIQRKFLGIFLFSLVGITVSSGDSPVCNTDYCIQLSKRIQSYMNQSVAPCDDFYQYACGNYKNLYHLKPNEMRQDSFEVVQQLVNREMDSAIGEQINSSSVVIKFLSNLYVECNQTHPNGLKQLTQTITDTLGTFPILGKSGNASAKWPELYIRLATQYTLAPILGLGYTVDRKTQETILSVGPGPTGLAYPMLANPHQFEKAIKAYRNYIHQAALLMGATDDESLEKAVDGVLKLETNLALAWQRNPHMLIRQTTFDAFSLLMNGRVDFLSLINKAFHLTQANHPANLTPSDPIVVFNPGFLFDAIRVMDESPEVDQLNLFGWLIAMRYGHLVSDKFKHLDTKFRTALDGAAHELNRWESCYYLVLSRLPMAVSRVYTGKYFKPEDRAEAKTLIKHIRESFRNLLTTNTWLDEKTRNKAIEKLDYIKEYVAYPDWPADNRLLDQFYDFSKNESIVKEEFLKSALKLQVISVRKFFDTLGTKPNHTFDWTMIPVMVNAAYDPSDNSIAIPAAILHDPFFTKSRPYSMNYGAIGAIIGHEFTHGFDNNGRHFDRNGQWNDWWTPQTAQKFNERAQCFVKQYDEIYIPELKMHVNGQQTLPENIADNGGLKEAFHAFLAHQNQSGNAAPVLPNLKLSAEQLFFLSYANNWCGLIRPEALRSDLKMDVHAPDQFRVNTPLSNLDEFASTFHCPPGSKLNPRQKCAVW